MSEIMGPLFKTSGALVNTWGGVVTPVVFAGNSSQFQVTETGVPTDGCARMLTVLAILVSAKVNGVAVVLPVDAGGVVSSCSASANTMIFVFGH